MDNLLAQPVLAVATDRVEVPKVEVIFLERPDLPSVGVRERAQRPVAAAIAKAFSAGFAVQVRDRPITENACSRPRQLTRLEGA